MRMRRIERMLEQQLNYNDRLPQASSHERTIQRTSSLLLFWGRAKTDSTWRIPKSQWVCSWDRELVR
jgi:hypothetical protein